MFVLFFKKKWENVRGTVTGTRNPQSCPLSSQSLISSNLTIHQPRSLISHQNPLSQSLTLASIALTLKPSHLSQSLALRSLTLNMQESMALRRNKKGGSPSAVTTATMKLKSHFFASSIQVFFCRFWD